jgi:nicotinate-nucleotide adenylyltransferase
MIKIAIYSGSFNPIGKHHLNIANAVTKLGMVDEVWIMPCFRSMSNKKLEYEIHRLNMCEIAIRNNGNDKVKLCDFEISNKLVEQSFDIFSKFLGEYDQTNKFYFIIGADNAIAINTWKDYAKLINLIPFIVIPRPDYDVPSNSWCYNEPHIYLEDVVADNASSTLIRQNIKLNGESNLVTNGTDAYITNHKLYIN